MSKMKICNTFCQFILHVKQTVNCLLFMKWQKLHKIINLLQGQNRDNSNTFFFTIKRNMFSYIIFVCRIISFFEGIYFVLSYSTHKWNAYIAGNLLKIKNAKNEACLENVLITGPTKKYSLFPNY